MPFIQHLRQQLNELQTMLYVEQASMGLLYININKDEKTRLDKVQHKFNRHPAGPEQVLSV